jgi:hypothetical protein
MGPLILLAIVTAILWLTLSAVVLALCRTAAGGDRDERARVRFARRSARRAAAAVRANRPPG